MESGEYVENFLKNYQAREFISFIWSHHWRKLQNKHALRLVPFLQNVEMLSQLFPSLWSPYKHTRERKQHQAKVRENIVFSDRILKNTQYIVLKTS